jgi:hypothetical protein
MATFITTAGVKLSQTTGYVGMKLDVRGSGFKTGGKVTIDYDNLRVTSVTADNDGAFNTHFNIPVSNGGAHVVTVSDGEITKKFVFTVESEAPPAPALALPAVNSEARARAYLDWEDVTDPSLPVTYSLQVAADENFSSLVLEKEGLADSEYLLTEEEQLKAVERYSPYYWRVKAEDSANNLSEWSDSWLFYVNAPPPPELILPASDSQAEMPVFFYWQSVTSLSPPVTYNIQVATDLSFTSIVLEKEGLTGSDYVLSEEEDLPVTGQKFPYYWRVKATDNVNNTSDWSVVWSFYNKSPFTFPGWATYTLIGIGVIIIGFLAFWVGRRTAFRQEE